MKKFVLCCMSAVMILGASTLSSSAVSWMWIMGKLWPVYNLLRNANLL